MRMDEEQEKHGEDTSRMLKSPEEQGDHKKYEILGNSLTRNSQRHCSGPGLAVCRNSQEFISHFWSREKLSRKLKTGEPVGLKRKKGKKI